jgi:hypothetical protein
MKLRIDSRPVTVRIAEILISITCRKQGCHLKSDADEHLPHHLCRMYIEDSRIPYDRKKMASIRYWAAVHGCEC